MVERRRPDLKCRGYSGGGPANALVRGLTDIMFNQIWPMGYESRLSDMILSACPRTMATLLSIQVETPDFTMLLWVAV